MNRYQWSMCCRTWSFWVTLSVIGLLVWGQLLAAAAVALIAATASSMRSRSHQMVSPPGGRGHVGRSRCDHHSHHNTAVMRPRNWKLYSVADPRADERFPE